jgi:hypothetical protein
MPRVAPGEPLYAPLVREEPVDVSCDEIVALVARQGRSAARAIALA